MSIYVCASNLTNQHTTVYQLNFFPMKLKFYAAPLLAFCILSSTVSAQNTTTAPAAPATPAPSFGISLGGFAKLDYGVDSRQTVNLREGHFSIYPAPEAKGPDGKDVKCISKLLYARRSIPPHR